MSVSAYTKDSVVEWNPIVTNLLWANLIWLGHYWDQNVHHDLEDVLILCKSLNTFMWLQGTSSFLFGCGTFSSKIIQSRKSNKKN